MKTTKTPKISDIKRLWHLIDAKDKIVGKIATKAADLLRGKHKPLYTPHMDCGDFVIIINAKHIALTGKKLEQKEYFRHSRYFGNLKRKTARQLLEKNPEDILYNAIRGMIRDNKLRSLAMRKLKIFAEEKHPHEAQKPTQISIV